MHYNYKHDVFSRILAKSTKRENGCVEYAETKHRYGLVSITIDGKRKSIPVHRALYMAVNDCFDLDRNTVIRHTCDNPRCVNIKHLTPGTQKDNVQDCIERGRKAKTHKYHHRTRIHDESLVESIRNATGKVKWIALEHGVSIGYVSKIKNGKLKA